MLTNLDQSLCGKSRSSVFTYLPWHSCTFVHLLPYQNTKGQDTEITLKQKYLSQYAKDFCNTGIYQVKRIPPKMASNFSTKCSQNQLQDKVRDPVIFQADFSVTVQIEKTLAWGFLKVFWTLSSMNSSPSRWTWT